MSAKNKKYNKPGVKPVKQGDTQARVQQPVKKFDAKIKLTQLHYMLIAGLLVVAFYCYHNTLQNKFTNWDDGLYVETCNYIKNLTWPNMKMILFHNITNNYYHPLTMLTFAANYHFAKMDPHAYYLTEVIIFLSDVVMMFMLSLTLLETINALGYGKIKGIPWLAAFCALFYGAHPMHVESASWIAERKDIMYVFFYFLGMIMYIKYALNQTNKRLGYVVLCFVLSLASKPMAVFFPLSLFALDILLKRDKETSEPVSALNILYSISKPIAQVFTGMIKKINDIISTETLAKLISEKLPFVIVCILSGLWSYYTADKAGSIASFHAFSLWNRLFFAAHNFMMYFYKAFVPTDLCSFYPYPSTSMVGNLPWDYYLSPLIDLIIVGVPLYFSFKAGEKYFRVTLFGFTYFFFNVVFILQIISAGPAIMCERYTDAAYFGIFFMLSYYIYVLLEKIPSIKVPLLTGIALAGGIFAYLTEQRTLVWHNTESLWKDVIAKYPYHADTTFNNAQHTQYTVKVQAGVETAYKNLGNYYVQDVNPPQYDSAYLYYKVLEDMKSTDAGVYSNLGNIWAIRRNLNKSLEEYTKSLKLDSNSFDTYLDRGITYASIGQYDLAIQDYMHAYKLDPTSQKLFESRGYTYLQAKQYQNALNDYNRLIQIEPDLAIYYFNRGVAESNLGDNKTALNDFLTDLKADPKNANCMFNLSVVYKSLGDYNAAINYATQAKQGGYQVSDAYMQELQTGAKGSASK
jgi:tetratricopeptide (TPR) repeat protein